METLDGNNSSQQIDTFFKNHEKILNTPQGKSLYCNAVDLIFGNALPPIEESYEILNTALSFTKHYIVINDNSNLIPFTPCIKFKNVQKVCLMSLSEQKSKKQTNKLLLKWNLPLKYALYVPYGDPSDYIKVSCLYQCFFDNEHEKKFSEEKRKELMQWCLAKHPAMLANFILAGSIHLIEGLYAAYYPYACPYECYKEHIYHLENIANKLPCIFLNEKSLFSPQKVTPFYNESARLMLAELLELMPFYKPMCELWKNNFMPLLHDIYKNNALDKNFLTAYLQNCQHLSLTIQDSATIKTVASLKEYYKEYHAFLLTRDGYKYRSNWVFGRFETTTNRTLSRPENIFNYHTFFELPASESETSVSTRNVISEINNKDVEKELLNEYYHTKKNKKNMPQERQKKQPIKTKKTEGNYKNKNNQKNTHTLHASSYKKHDKKEFLLQKVPTDLPVETKPLNLQEKVEQEIMSHALVYSTRYLNRCNALKGDNYHDMPFVLDVLVKEHGHCKTDYKDRSKKCFFWPVFTKNRASNIFYNYLYVIIEDNQKSIVHRGPISFENPNLYIKFRKEQDCFDTLINNALEKVESENQKNNYASNSHQPVIAEYYDDEDNSNLLLSLPKKSTSIKNPFKGPFASTIQVFGFYLLILDLLNNQEIYFPLITQ